MLEKANLVIQTAFLGDLILSVPVLRRIKKLYPQQRLILVCKKGIGQFLEQQGIVDQIIEIEKSNAESYEQALKVLRSFELQHLFCLHRSVRSLLFSARLSAVTKIGFSSFLGFWIFDETVEHIAENPEVIRQFKILSPVDSETATQLDLSSFAHLNQVEPDGKMAVVPDFFAFDPSAPKKMNTASAIRVALFPGSVWATKQWTQQGFTELVRLLNRSGYQVDLFGGAAEKPLCEQIALDSGLQDQIGVLAGTLSVAQSIEHLKSYDVVISNDSASTHMAAYNQLPVVSIFGPTVLSMGFRPWADHLRIVENPEMSCRPCGRHGHRKCPLGHHLCMKTITARQVYDRVQSLLQEVTFTK